MRLLCFLLATSFALAQDRIPPTHEKLIPTVWTQTSVEWRAGALQAYRLAKVQLDAALADPLWNALAGWPQEQRTAEPAVILDIDETVLDNSPGQARQVMAGTDFVPAQWNQWVDEAKADPVPGAAEFCRYAYSRGVRVFYITNRDQGQEAKTRENLARHGFPLGNDNYDTVLTRGEAPGGSDKEERRKKVARLFRVVLLVGDDLGDFLPNVRDTPEKRAALAAPYSEYWGYKWILLPNPSYGSWEQAVNGDAGTAAERLERKTKSLNPRQ
ncbi:MAG: HAD family acid phosphatase [Bryobacteraceae bacterium]